MGTPQNQNPMEAMNGIYETTFAILSIGVVVLLFLLKNAADFGARRKGLRPLVGSCADATASKR